MVDFKGPFAVDIMGDMQNYADEALETAQGYLEDLSDYVLDPIVFTHDAIEIDREEYVPAEVPAHLSPPDAPLSSEYPDAPDDVTVGDHSFPAQPSITLPTPPTLHEITVPDYTAGLIREITTPLPAVDFAVPTIADLSTSDVTFGTLVQAIRDKLESNISNGGTMLDSSVEDDIWNRDLERHEQQLQDSIDKVTAQWAKLGFSLPDGLLADNLLAINNKYLEEKAERSRTIAIKQAELEQDGMFKSIQFGIEIEKVVIMSGHEYLKRALDAAKATADVTIEIFKQRVLLYNTNLEKFKADVAAYKTSIEAELARVMAYKERIGGLKLIVEADESQVKTYAAHVEAVSKLVDLYNTQVKAVATMYDAEKTKVEAYRMRVEAYVAKVNAIGIPFRDRIERYKSYVQGWSSYADAKGKEKDYIARIDIAELEATMKQWEIELKLTLDNLGLKLEALKTAAQTSSNLAAGSLSAIHASLSDSYGESLSESHSYSY